MKKTSITWEQVKALLPERVSLVYIDYRDSLDNRLDALQQAIHENNLYPIDEKIFDSILDTQDEGVRSIEDTLQEDIASTFDLDQEEVSDTMELYKDEIQDEIYNRDDSDYIKDLLDNTCKQVMFFDTGYEMESESWNWDEKRVAEEVKNIKRALKLKLKDTTNDADISMMVRQASYGGQLVVYFYLHVDEFIGNNEDLNEVQFGNAAIAIIDTCNGSGDHCHLKDVVVTLPFERKNIFICETVKYSYTYEVCGMSSDWCEDTNVTLLHKKVRKPVVTELSKVHAHIEKEAGYNKTYKAGSCTSGDMDITRHRDTPYINDYPCGNRCSACGTFFID